jgi:hypothetical protein
MERMGGSEGKYLDKARASGPGTASQVFTTPSLVRGRGGGGVRSYQFSLLPLCTAYKMGRV